MTVTLNKEKKAHMFKETDKNIQYDMFGSVSGVLVGESLKEYGDDKGWHNRFREQVSSRIDESTEAFLRHVQK